MKKNLKIFFVVSVMASLALGCAHGGKWTVQDTFHISDTARVVAWQQGACKDWYGGAVQGGQALVQLIPKGQMLQEKIKLAWRKQFSRCPSDEQIYQVEKGWNEFLVWSEKNVRYEEMVTIISTFNHPLKAPGPVILTAIMDAVSRGATAAIGGVFFERAMAAIRPANYQNSQTVSGVSNADASTAPITMGQNQGQISNNTNPITTTVTTSATGGDSKSTSSSN